MWGEAPSPDLFSGSEKRSPPSPTHPHPLPSLPTSRHLSSHHRLSTHAQLKKKKQEPRRAHRSTTRTGACLPIHSPPLLCVCPAPHHGGRPQDATKLSARPQCGVDQRGRDGRHGCGFVGRLAPGRRRRQPRQPFTAPAPRPRASPELCSGTHAKRCAVRPHSTHPPLPQRETRAKNRAVMGDPQLPCLTIHSPAPHCEHTFPASVSCTPLVVERAAANSRSALDPI